MDRESRLFVPEILQLPLIEELVSGGIDYATLILVEFESHSLWYDAVITIAVQALKKGIRVDFHTFSRSPSKVKRILARFGLDVAKLQNDDSMRMIDSYTLQTGLGSPENPKGADELFNVAAITVKLSEWPAAAVEQFEKGMPESEKRRLHIDDDLTVLTRYNSEAEILDFWRTRVIPLFRARESVLVNALEFGIASDRFTKQFEALSDGIIDLSSREEHGRVEQYARMRTLHGRIHDSSWRRVQLSKDGVVSVAPPGRATKLDYVNQSTEPDSRALATILFIDIVGSTEHLVRLGDEEWGRVIIRHNEIVRRELENFQGHEAKITGDGFLLTFDSPTKGIGCARAIRDAVRELGIEIRAGLHTGEHLTVGNDLAGIAVHTAARVAALAGPSQILVSSTVKELVAGSGILFEDHGLHMLKGIPDESHLFAVI